MRPDTTKYPVLFTRDGGAGMKLGELIERLIPFVKMNNQEGFSRKLDELFLGGCYGDHFDLLAERGMDAGSFAKDLRGLVWDALKPPVSTSLVLCLCDDCAFKRAPEELSIGGHKQKYCDGCGYEFGPGLTQAHHYWVHRPQKGKR